MVRSTIMARWVKFAGLVEVPVPPTIPDRPRSSRDTRLMQVVPAGTVDRTFARYRTVRVNWGAMSSVHVRIVFVPACTLPALPAAHPLGVIVHPEHGSSSPNPGLHTSSWSGTVSHTLTFHHVFCVDTFLRKTS